MKSIQASTLARHLRVQVLPLAVRSLSVAALSIGSEVQAARRPAPAWNHRFAAATAPVDRLGQRRGLKSSPFRRLAFGGRSHGNDEDEDGEVETAHEAETENSAAKEYLGVVYNATKIKKYAAELELDGHLISGGDYWTALDAAKAYDELVALYCDLETPRNFPAGVENEEHGSQAVAASESDWEVPEVGKRHADLIPPIPQTYLTLEEVTAALEKEKAIDVYTVDLAGKSSLADYMIFTTGRSQAHMRRMADMLILSLRARNVQDDFEYSVEGRDCDDWMIADCNNIVVHFMRAETRRILNLEDHWENMVDDKHRVYGDMTEDEYMDKFGTSELMDELDDSDRPILTDEDRADGIEWK